MNLLDLVHDIVAPNMSYTGAGAHGGQGAHLRLSYPELSARTGSPVVIDTWSGVVAPLKIGKTAQGAWCAARGAFRALPASLLSSLPGCNDRGVGGHRLPCTSTPPGAYQVRSRGWRFVVVTAVCIYRHLPLVYQFSDGWGFAFKVYSQKCWILTDYRGLNAAIYH